MLLSHVFPNERYRLCGADWTSKVVGDIAYEVDCSMIIVKEGEVDIGASQRHLTTIVS